MSRHVRHVGYGRLDLFSGDDYVREIGETAGWDFKDRDEFIARYNEYETLRAQLEAAEHNAKEWEEMVVHRNGQLNAAEARAEAAEAECARLRSDASRTIAALWDGHMRAEGILGPHNENQVIEEALCVISDCANQSFRWPESIRENIESAYDEIDAARTKEQQA